MGILIVSLLAPTSLGFMYLWLVHSPYYTPGLQRVIVSAYLTDMSQIVMSSCPGLRCFYFFFFPLNFCLKYQYFSCLATFLLFLHSLIFLFSYLLVGSLGRPQRLKPFSTKKKGGTKGAFVFRAPQGPAQFQKNKK